MLAFYFRASDDDAGRGRNGARGDALAARTARRGREVSMFWKQVTKTAVTAGTAEGGTPLNAFDNALLAAGIGNVNLIKVSSIVPPDVDIVDLPQIKPGALVPTAYAAMTSTTPGQIIAAAVGYALPVDRTKPGVIMEFHDVTDRGTAEEAIRGMLAEAFRVRGETVREVKVVAVDHRVERAGCALAAVALLSEDDLL
jgi:arginine decarboxylase